MPRIDPLQLLKCLSVLLSQEGGILSRDEVPRLVNLMTKFSKKLVSKCVYVLILKNTETSLVDMFMAEGGWTLIQTWLQDAAQSGNWVLVKEILGLLLITPVDVERLKMNCLPKLIKNLSRREDLDGVAELSNQIVQNWLIIVKGSAHGMASNPPSVQSQLEKRKPDTDSGGVVIKDVAEPDPLIVEEAMLTTEVLDDINDENTENDQSINTSTFYKSVKDNKETGKKSSEGDKTTTDSNNVEEELRNGEIKDNKINEKDREKSSKSSSSRSKSSSSSSRDRDRDKDRKRSSHSSSSRSKSSSSRDKDRRDKDRDRKDKDRSKHSSSRSSSSKSSSKDKKESKDKSRSNDGKDVKDFKEIKEKQAERDKDTLQKLKPQTLDKLGRIPKKSSSASDEKQKEDKTETKSKDDAEKDSTKKPSFSILNRKGSGEERTKTVKVFNSKMRSTGLEEEVKPPPPRSAKKPTPSVQLPTIPPKRPSPTRDFSSMPPEKKLKIDKIDLPERPGAIKLIPPKPKPPVLQESDMFMDALTASAPKKEAKKRKRRLSVTKDAPTSPSSSPAGGDPLTPTSPTPTGQSTTALGLKNIAPINFYQDTLSEEPDKVEENKNEANDAEDKDSPTNNINSPETNDTPASPIPSNDADPLVENEPDPTPSKAMKSDGLKGVLLYTKKKGPKRSITWKAEEQLVDIRYFELDETERVNVTKTFGDMAKMDISSEREALIMSRKPAHDDFMEPLTMWRMLYICDQPEHLAGPGSKSLEKDIQFAREKTVLPAIYFDKRRIPDNPEEPIPETHQMSDPVIIPLDDQECQEMDLRNTPWPEPKGSAPQIEPQPMPPMFPNIPFNPSFNNIGSMPPVPPFVGVPPRFPGPAGPLGPMGPGPVPYGPPNMMHNNMMGPPMNQQEIMNQGPINPGMYGPVPDGYMGPVNEQNFPMPQFNGPPGPNMNMYGPNNFNHRGGDGDGGYRRGGNNNGGWVRMNGPRNNWKRGRGGGARGGRKCKNIQNHGYCRNGDSCPFVH